MFQGCWLSHGSNNTQIVAEELEVEKLESENLESEKLKSEIFNKIKNKIDMIMIRTLISK